MRGLNYRSSGIGSPNIYVQYTYTCMHMMINHFLLTYAYLIGREGGREGGSALAFRHETIYVFKPCIMDTLYEKFKILLIED